jgi:uncharacterized iron-regulated membrane protein
MRANTTYRRWSWIHRWTSLVCTLFLLMLCITGLPLIFHHEIDHLLHEEVEPAKLPAGTPHADLDRVAANALARLPGHVIQFLFWDRDEPDLVFASAGVAPDSDPERNRLIRSDAHTGEVLEEVDFRTRLTFILLKLHTDMFAGLPGKLFLGLMGLLFAAAIVSGIVVYGPSMRKLEFGTVRHHRIRSVRWLDIHNLCGVVLIAWTLVVGLTGVLNTWADLVIKLWQFDQLAEMVAASKDAPVPAQPGSVQAAVAVARERLPEMVPSFVAYPGTIFSGKSHYAVFMRGDTPLTSRLLKPVLIDAASGNFTDSRDLPWYVSTLLLSQPLHFGDYGGMPLKIIWALLDIATIVVLVTGLYLWLARRRAATELDPIDDEGRNDQQQRAAGAAS